MRMCVYIYINNIFACQTCAIYFLPSILICDQVEQTGEDGVTVPDHEVITRRKQFRMKRDVAEKKTEKKQERKKDKKEKEAVKAKKKQLRELKKKEKAEAQPKKRGRKPKVVQEGEEEIPAEKKIRKTAQKAKGSKSSGSGGGSRASGSAALGRPMRRLLWLSPGKEPVEMDLDLANGPKKQRKTPEKTKKRKAEPTIEDIVEEQIVEQIVEEVVEEAEQVVEEAGQIVPADQGDDQQHPSAAEPKSKAKKEKKTQSKEGKKDRKKEDKKEDKKEGKTSEKKKSEKKKSEKSEKAKTSEKSKKSEKKSSTKSGDGGSSGKAKKSDREAKEKQGPSGPKKLRLPKQFKDLPADDEVKEKVKGVLKECAETHCTHPSHKMLQHNTLDFDYYWDRKACGIKADRRFFSNKKAQGKGKAHVVYFSGTTSCPYSNILLADLWVSCLQAVLVQYILLYVYGCTESGRCLWISLYILCLYLSMHIKSNINPSILNKLYDTSLHAWKYRHISLCATCPGETLGGAGPAWSLQWWHASPLCSPEDFARGCHRGVQEFTSRGWGGKRWLAKPSYPLMLQWALKFWYRKQLRSYIGSPYRCCQLSYLKLYFCICGSLWSVIEFQGGQEPCFAMSGVFGVTLPYVDNVGSLRNRRAPKNELSILHGMFFILTSIIICCFSMNFESALGQGTAALCTYERRVYMEFANLAIPLIKSETLALDRNHRQIANLVAISARAVQSRLKKDQLWVPGTTHDFIVYKYIYQPCRVRILYIHLHCLFTLMHA